MTPRQFSPDRNSPRVVKGLREPCDRVMTTVTKRMMKPTVEPTDSDHVAPPRGGEDAPNSGQQDSTSEWYVEDASDSEEGYIDILVDSEWYTVSAREWAEWSRGDPAEESEVYTRSGADPMGLADFDSHSLCEVGD